MILGYINSSSRAATKDHADHHTCDAHGSLTRNGRSLRFPFQRRRSTAHITKDEGMYRLIYLPSLHQVRNHEEKG